MKKLLLALLLIISANANANVFDHPLQSQDIANVKATIPVSSILISDFKQVKKVHGIEKPLPSSGKMIYAAERGLYWQILKPFEVVYVFTPKGMLQQEDGEKTIIPAEEYPLFMEFSQIFQSIFSGDYDELAKYFDVFYTNNNGKWTLGLRPLNIIIMTVVTDITITGGKNIETISFTETNGDSTKIQLLNVDASAKTLRKEQENYFVF
jgi:hypothetical protein